VPPPRGKTKTDHSARVLGGSQGYLTGKQQHVKGLAHAQFLSYDWKIQHFNLKTCSTKRTDKLTRSKERREGGIKTKGFKCLLCKGLKYIQLAYNSAQRLKFL